MAAIGESKNVSTMSIDEFSGSLRAHEEMMNRGKKAVVEEVL